MPLKLTKELYSENIFLWCNILPLGKSAVTLMPGLKLCLNLLQRLPISNPSAPILATLWSNVCVSRLPYRCRIALGRGQGCPAPLILDLTEALRAEKKKFKSVPPPYCRVWTTLSPLSEDLDQPLQGDYWSLICAFCCFFSLCISARSSEQRSRKKDAKSF